MSRLIRSYPPEYRRWILEQLAVSTESLVAFSAHSGIPASTLSTWRFLKRQRGSETPDPNPSVPEVPRVAPSDLQLRELECEVAVLRAEVERERIAFAHQALELAEALVENFCLRSGLNPTEFRVSRVPATPATNQEPQR